MRGKKSASACPSRALAATSVSSAWIRSGRRSSSREGTPGGTSGGTTCSASVAPRAIVPAGRPTSTESSFSLATIWRSRSGTRAAACASAASAAQRVELRDDAAQVLALEQVVGLLEGHDRLARDRELAVELGELEPGLRHARHEREHDAAPERLGREQVRARRLGGAPDAAPHVDLPDQVRRGEEVVLGPAAGGRASEEAVVAARRGALVAELREELAALHAGQVARHLDVRGRHREVAVVRQRLVDQRRPARRRGTPPTRAGRRSTRAASGWSRNAGGVGSSGRW